MRRTVRWNAALGLFSALGADGFQDSVSRASECQAWIDYQAAEELFSNKKYYDAYKAFKAIDGRYEGMPDLNERAQACVQSFPSNGAVYVNDRYSFNDLELTIDNSNYTNVYYKLYIGDNLVMSVFVSGGGSATVDLPAGAYTMNKAYGDMWFGTNDMFGDEGSYYHCNFGASDSVELEAGYVYEISTGGEGTGIGTSSTDRGSF